MHSQSWPNFFPHVGRFATVEGEKRERERLGLVWVVACCPQSGPIWNFKGGKKTANNRTNERKCLHDHYRGRERRHSFLPETVYFRRFKTPMDKQRPSTSFFQDQSHETPRKRSILCWESIFLHGMYKTITWRILRISQGLFKNRKKLVCYGEEYFWTRVHCFFLCATISLFWQEGLGDFIFPVGQVSNFFTGLWFLFSLSLY